MKHAVTRIEWGPALLIATGDGHFFIVGFHFCTDATPQLLHTFNEQTLVPGPYVTFKCTAIGNPTPDFVWLLDKYPLANSERYCFKSCTQQGYNMHHIFINHGSLQLLARCRYVNS